MIVVAVVAAVALSILAFAEIGGVRGKTIPVYAVMGDVRDIIPNTAVWLHGEQVGVVRRVNFRDTATEPDERVLVSMDILERARPYVRKDALVQIRRGESYLGAPVIYLTGGSPYVGSVNSGDTLRSTVRLDQQQLSADISAGLSDARAVFANIRRATDAVGQARGTVASLLGLEGAERSELEMLVESVRELSNGLGRMTARHDEDLRVRAVEIRERLTRLGAESRSGSVQRLLSDQELRDGLTEVTRELTDLRALVRARRDSLRALPAADDSSARELARVESALDALLSDIGKRPWRYIGF